MCATFRHQRNCDTRIIWRFSLQAAPAMIDWGHLLYLDIDWGHLLYLDQQVVELCPLRCDVDKGCSSAS